VCVYVYMLLENICSQSDDFETAFEFLNENLRGWYFLLFAFFQPPGFLLFFKTTHRP